VAFQGRYAKPFLPVCSPFLDRLRKEIKKLTGGALGSGFQPSARHLSRPRQLPEILPAQQGGAAGALIGEYPSHRTQGKAAICKSGLWPWVETCA
jgi:hypothetical protein